MAMVVMGGMYVQSMLETVLYSLRLLVVVGEHIAVAMVVVGHICTHNIMVVHNTIY